MYTDQDNMGSEMSASLAKTGTSSSHCVNSHPDYVNAIVIIDTK
jgi:hypothetical protein